MKYQSIQLIPVSPITTATISPYWSTYPGNSGSEALRSTRDPTKGFENDRKQINSNNVFENSPGSSEIDKSERDARQGSNQSNNENLGNEPFSQGVRHNTVFGPSPPGAIPTLGFGGSTTTPRGGFAHASGQVDSGEIPGKSKPGLFRV